MSVYFGSGTATEVPAHPAVRTVRHLFLLVARVGLGVLMVAHAWLEYDFAGRSISGVGSAC
jgi:hypothetical protein